MPKLSDMTVNSEDQDDEHGAEAWIPGERSETSFEIRYDNCDLRDLADTPAQARVQLKGQGKGWPCCDGFHPLTMYKLTKPYERDGESYEWVAFCPNRTYPFYMSIINLELGVE